MEERTSHFVQMLRSKYILCTEGNYSRIKHHLKTVKRYYKITTIIYFCFKMEGLETAQNVAYSDFVFEDSEAWSEEGDITAVS